MAPVFGLLSAGLSLVGGLQQAQSAQVQGAVEADRLNFEALQQEKQANQEAGIKQREAERRDRETRFVKSRIQALAASSGADASDQSILTLLGEVEEEGDLQSRTLIAEGRNLEDSLKSGAAARRVAGTNVERAAKRAASAARFSAIASFGAGVAKSFASGSGTVLGGGRPAASAGGYRYG